MHAYGFHCYMDVLNSVEKSIDICMQLLPSCVLQNWIAGLVKRNQQMEERGEHDRVMKIRVVIDSNSTHSIKLKEKLGCDIKMNANPGNRIMHHKFVITDDDNNINININHINNNNNRAKLLTGSLNWSEAAFHYNHENVLMIEDKKVINSYQIEFNDPWDKLGDYEPTMDGADDAPNDGANDQVEKSVGDTDGS